MVKLPDNTGADTVGIPLGPQDAAKAALGGIEEPEVERLEPGQAPPADGQAQGPSIEQQWHDTLTLGIATAMNILAKRWTSFATTPEEVKGLADAWTPVCVKHWPNGLPMELVAVAATGVVLAPKVMGAIGEERAKRKAKADAQATKPDPGTHIAS